MKKLQTEQDLRKEKYAGIIVLFLLVVFGLLAGTRVFVANRLVETSQNLKSLDQEITRLETENEVLTEALRSGQAIGTVENKISAMGFTPTFRLAHLSRPAEVAYKLP